MVLQCLFSTNTHNQKAIHTTDVPIFNEQYKGILCQLRSLASGDFLAHSISLCPLQCGMMESIIALPVGITVIKEISVIGMGIEMPEDESVLLKMT